MYRQKIAAPAQLWETWSANLLLLSQNKAVVLTSWQVLLLFTSDV